MSHHFHYYLHVPKHHRLSSALLPSVLNWCPCFRLNSIHNPRVTMIFLKAWHAFPFVKSLQWFPRWLKIESQNPNNSLHAPVSPGSPLHWAHLPPQTWKETDLRGNPQPPYSSLQFVQGISSAVTPGEVIRTQIINPHSKDEGSKRSRNLSELTRLESTRAGAWTQISKLSPEFFLLLLGTAPYPKLQLHVQNCSTPENVIYM